MIKENQRLLNTLNVLSDGLLLLLSLVAAYLVRFHIFTGLETHEPLSYYLKCSVAIVPFFLFLYSFSGLYGSWRTGRFLREFELLARADLIGTVMVVAVMFIIKEINISRWVLVFFFLFATGSVGVKRYLLRSTLRYLRSNGKNLKHVLLVGGSPLAARYAATVASDHTYGYQVTGCVCTGSPPPGIPRLGGIGDLEALLHSMGIDDVVAALSVEEQDRIAEIIEACEKEGVKLSFIPYYADYMPAHPYIDEVGDIPLMNIRHIPLDNLAHAFFKRAFDIAGSLVLILLTSPLMLFCAVGTRLSSPGPVIFRQERVGRYKQPFTMYKFRSMRQNAASDTAWSTNSDPRKTRFGAFLRKFSLDELPQFFNVLKGDMSLVGPRPELPHFVEQFRQSVPRYMVKHQVRPGITGWAQVNGLRGDTSIPERIRHDLYYIENWSFLFDCKILLMTAGRAFVNQEVILPKKELSDGKEKTN